MRRRFSASFVAPLLLSCAAALARSPMDARTIADPLPLAKALIACRSITPAEAGVLDVAQAALDRIGFRTRRMKFGEVDNLYARFGDAAPNFCFAGHLDVVPPGEGWT